MTADELVLARNGPIPAVGCGTWELRGEACSRIVAEALRLGYRHIDTAQGYDNETAVGEGLRASGVPRDAVFVTTKVRPQRIAEGDLQRSAVESLERLGLDQVDLLLIHWPNPQVPVAAAVQALADARKRGLTRHVGVSNFTIAHLAEARRATDVPIVTNQIEYHPYLDQSRILGEIRRLGMTITAYCPIALGKVANDRVIRKIGAAHGRTAVQVALRWLVQQGDVAVIPRTSSADRLAENLAILDFRLTDGEMEHISRLTRPDSRLINEPNWVARWD